ncbi:nidogen-like domain-containing protein [Ditylenchus destructor]|uniref:Nidogen-like domain-containing protein n=1 Tax=Ditylenchus destructor TaxID=166010 RepID=A0AAD4R019_9BILA|nr:nidogen-like domain-containing protein [Ditylenchus destructor]
MGRTGVPLSRFFWRGRQLFHGGEMNKKILMPKHLRLPFFGRDREALLITADGAIFVGSRKMDKDDDLFIYNSNTDCMPTFTGPGAIVPFPYSFLTETGKFFHRQTSNRKQLKKAKREVLRAFPHFHHLRLKWIFVLTYWDMGHRRSHGRVRNAFQSITATDGRHTFAIFYYAKLQSKAEPSATRKIADAWSGNVAESEELGDAAFYSGSHDNGFAYIEGSCSNRMRHLLLAHSNLAGGGRRGVWVYRIDESRIKSPACAEPAHHIGTNEEVLQACSAVGSSTDD